jgi:hypothetical protein
MVEKERFRWWSLFYTKEELTQTLQNFNEDTSLVKAMRYFFLGTNLILFTAFLEFESLQTLLLFFTMWTSLFTIEYFFFIGMVQYTEEAPVSLLALHHILFQVTLVMNVIVVVIYWSILYKLDMRREHMINNLYRQWLHVFIHTWPFFCVFANLAASKITMKKNQGYFLVPISVAYSVVNYFGTLKLGRPLYPFLNWKNPYVYLIVTLIFLFAWGVHNALASFSLWLRKKSEPVLKPETAQTKKTK